jgi:hypothetical protein
MNNVLNEVVAERQRQEQKWGEQNHEPFKWLAILGEEVGEANQAVVEAHFQNNNTANPKDFCPEKLKEYRTELVQVAAVAVSMIESLDRNELKNEQVDIKDRVKTFEDACEILGINPQKVLRPFDTDWMTGDQKSIAAYCKLTIILRALNEGWQPDWNNSDQRKYYPWMKFVPGSGFSYCGFVYDAAASRVGSRLCVHSEELARYAGEQFKQEYNDFLSL